MKLKINASALESAIRQTCAGMRACPFIEQEVFAIAEQNGMQVQVVITRDEDSFIEEVSGEFTVPDKVGTPDAMLDKLQYVGEAVPDKPQWVSCEERLPTKEDSDCHNEVWGCNYSGAYRFNWAAFEVERRDYKLTHWMPTGLQRPEAPGESE